MKPIEQILDQVAWQEIPDAWMRCHDAFGNDERPTPFVTHTGVLTVGEFTFKVFQLSDGERVFDVEDLERFFEGGIPL